MRVLVTGATGNVGRHVTASLVEAGIPVRVLTRDPAKAPEGVEVVRGDLRKPSGAWFDGVDRLYLFPEPATAAQVVDLAKGAGVRRIVVLSSGAVTGGLDTTFHLPVEQAVERSGLEWTHVRPGEFAANKVSLWGPSIRAERVVRDANPDAAWFPVHEQDVADVAVKALVEDGHTGKAYDVNGPELVSLRDQVRAIARALGEDVRFEQVTPEQAREIYVAQGGFAAEAADFLLGFTDYDGNPADPGQVADFDPSLLGPLPTAEAVTGRPARTFAQWARDRVADFR
ncbi:NAD(P)H-binding protein [Kibdelosporangium persicum]|uniref:Nucleoside-diphosphate sugar epimerase n=1 Tax=Kibdelosporangium persicum TaxID=2698649 RepID=A0ABX2EWA9_9PSEU|nr:NAD(P)H-binding protein [Kibdelosporangium persicum]NRN63164.1 putative nucleoside-diphosphate sugar epimerase [Kibdelosporangium persicum]